MTGRVWLAVVLFLAAGAAGFGWWWSERPAPGRFWQGYAEADFVKIGPTQQGMLTEVLVSRGDEVAAGAPLFAQDDVSDRAARDQAAEMLAQAQRQLANLRTGAKPTEIEQAEANLADARATLVRTTEDLRRDTALLVSGAVSKQVVQQRQADNTSAQAKVDAMQAALAQARAPLGREPEIQGQRAAVAAARAALAMAEWRLAQRHVAAPDAGRIADVIALPGETMAAGAPVVSLLPPANIFVRFFVPEADLSMLHLGDAVALACDDCPADLTARISFISPQAEYTPPLIYSESSKSKLVFQLEARPDISQATRLNPGEPVEVRPAVAAKP